MLLKEEEGGRGERRRGGDLEAQIKFYIIEPHCGLFKLVRDPQKD